MATDRDEVADFTRRKGGIQPKQTRRPSSARLGEPHTRPCGHVPQLTSPFGFPLSCAESVAAMARCFPCFGACGPFRCKSCDQSPQCPLWRREPVESKSRAVPCSSRRICFNFPLMVNVRSAASTKSALRPGAPSARASCFPDRGRAAGARALGGAHSQSALLFCWLQIDRPAGS